LLTISMWAPARAVQYSARKVLRRILISETGVEVDVLGHAVGLPDLVSEHAVHRDVVPVAAHAADLGHEGAEALAQRFHGVLVAHPGHEAHEGRDVAPLGLDLRDLAGGDEARVLRLFRVHAVAAASTTTLSPSPPRA
jgi:hypothetical protein